MKKYLLGFLFAAVITLAACSGDNEEAESKNHSSHMDTNKDAEEASSSHEHNHTGTGEIPEGLAEAENPKYPVGSKAIIESDHMEGMKGAAATIAGAYSTTVYAVTYTPTTGGTPVMNHKWVIHEEIENAGEEPYKPGDEVVINSDHMEGMKGATATIDSAEQTTVYMVDFHSTTTSEEITNHKWVSESELSPAE